MHTSQPSTPYITSIPTTATKTAKSDPCSTFSVPCDAPLPVFAVDGLCTKPVDAEPEALDTAFPLLEPDPELLLPRCPFVPGPAPDKPGTVATLLLAAAPEPVADGSPADMFVPVPNSDSSTVLSLVIETVLLVPASEV